MEQRQHIIVALPKPITIQLVSGLWLKREAKAVTFVATKKADQYAEKSAHALGY